MTPRPVFVRARVPVRVTSVAVTGFKSRRSFHSFQSPPALKLASP